MHGDKKNVTKLFEMWFREESQKLLEAMNQTEIFEPFENSAKLQCPDCNFFTEIGIILRKQDKKNMAAIRRYFQGGTNKNIGEKKIMHYDRIALERHDYTATRADRLQNAKHWVLRLNADGPQKPLRQRPEIAVAFKQCL